MATSALWRSLRSVGRKTLLRLGLSQATIDRIRQALPPALPPPPTPSPYPMEIPAIEIQLGLDFLLLELPPRYQPMMPNGLGYLHNVLLKTGLRFQTVDANVLMYHRYHQERILGKVSHVTANGYVMKDDPWDNTNTAEWERDEVLDYFWLEIDDILKQIVRTAPKVVGLSVHSNNRALVNRFIRRLRVVAPQVVVVVGGYDCVYPDIGPGLCPDFDYMAIFEAELTIAPLLEAIVAGQRPKDLPGILSKYDTPGRPWQPAPLLADLDSVDYPRYQWTDLSLYQTFDCKHLVPVTASRGCHWGRCHFCAERFPFRCRSPLRVADEIEEMVHRGRHVFHFNESDVNGNPQMLFDLCTQIIQRGLKIRMMGQLRIDKRNTAEYFRHLRRAGFVYLRFGVDAWSEHTIRLQRKGYNIPMAIQNLRDCHAAGIFTTVNMVIGVPGETDDDVAEMIENIVRCNRYIGLVESLNTLILAGGSDYLRDPDRFKIRFRGDKEAILREHRYCVPTELWYSEDPYIDQAVRLERLDRICVGLHANGVNIGAFATRAVELLKQEATVAAAS